MTAHRYRIAVIALLAVLVLVGGEFFVAGNWGAAESGPAQPTDTEAPSEDPNYWNIEQMESASPAPMPGD